MSYPCSTPNPSTPINSIDRRTNPDSSLISSYLHYPTEHRNLAVAGSGRSVVRRTPKERIMWTETEVNALREGVTSYGKGNWVEILKRSPNQFNPSKQTQFKPTTQNNKPEKQIKTSSLPQSYKQLKVNYYQETDLLYIKIFQNIE